jgi:hypothetical protein
MLREDELIENILKSLQLLESVQNDSKDNPSIEKFSSYFYTPPASLNEKISELKCYLSASKTASRTAKQNAGKLLEQIAFLSFNSLKGITSIKSFQSSGPQYDLVVTGDTTHWLSLAKLLYLDVEARDMVVEAKAKKERLPDKDMARLCSILSLNLTGAGLGIFFTLEGATGFPKEGSTTQQRSIKDAQMRQVLFHAKTGKFIVVFDKNDIIQLGQKGSLIDLLILKIREISELTGLPTPSIEFKEALLPPHLKNL